MSGISTNQPGPQSVVKLAFGVPATEIDFEFLQGMANRMSVSYFKYGAVPEAKGKVNEIESLKKRLDLYLNGGTLRDGTVVAAGNTEYLMDVANFAMIEFIHKGEDSFRATDSHESPGLTLSSGQQTDGPHTYTDHQVSEKISKIYRRQGD